MRLRLIPIVVALAFAGCGDDEPASSARPTPTPTPAGETAATAGLTPCGLLTDADRKALRLEPGAERKAGAARNCAWDAESGAYTVAVGVFDTLGLGDIVSDSKVHRAKVHSRDARIYFGDLGACAIAIKVSATSRVDVSGASGGDGQQGCRMAARAAKLVETKLP